MNPIVDPEFKALIPPLTAEELQQLEANLLAEGCRNPLVVWGDHDVLLDGHNRFEICLKYNIHFGITELFLPDRNAARRWIINNQLGRRNLTAEQSSYLRGKNCHEEKHQGRRSDLTSDQNDQRMTTPEKSTEQSDVDVTEQLAVLNRILKAIVLCKRTCKLLIQFDEHNFRWEYTVSGYIDVSEQMMGKAIMLLEKNNCNPFIED